ncbi:MAG: hypothetical protein M1818_002116 [Claussenomyces sp. TS43310]|nr:MAG: hypothetical protein M1818_002116 [Claussenomyces sp. TS43310]
MRSDTKRRPVPNPWPSPGRPAPTVPTLNHDHSTGDKISSCPTSGTNCRDKTPPSPTLTESGDEVYIDARTEVPTTARTSVNADEVNVADPAAFDIPAFSPTNLKHIDDAAWRSYSVPAELLNAPPDSSVEIQSMIETSIERVLFGEDGLRQRVDSGFFSVHKEPRPTVQSEDVEERDPEREPADASEMRETAVFGGIETRRYEVAGAREIQRNEIQQGGIKPSIQYGQNIYSPGAYLAGMSGRWNLSQPPAQSNSRASVLSRGSEYGSESVDTSLSRLKGRARGLGSFFQRSKPKAASFRSVPQQLEPLQSGGSTATTSTTMMYGVIPQPREFEL